jgi:hypothetical protein
MEVTIEKLGRDVWRRAKHDFANRNPDTSWIRPGEPPVWQHTDPNRFWERFGAEYNMKVVMSSHKMGFTVIDCVKFNDEKSYVYFLLKWA